MQSTINTLRQYLLSRKVSWLNALPLPLWALNDIPGAVAPYSPHRQVFGRDPIGVGDLPPVVDSEGCGKGIGTRKAGGNTQKTVRQVPKVTSSLCFCCW